jgi:hypothetical protein
VFFPVRCISSVSPRFYFKKHTFLLPPYSCHLIMCQFATS